MLCNVLKSCRLLQVLQTWKKLMPYLLFRFSLSVKDFVSLVYSGLFWFESCFSIGGNTDIETMQSLSYPDAWLEASGYKERVVTRLA